VTGELTGVNSVEDIAATVVDNACAFLGALSGRVLLLNDGVLRTVAAPGVPLPYGYSEVALDADLPGAVVARTRQPLTLRNLGEIARRFPALATLYDGERSLHVAPLCIGDHCLGVFALTSRPTPSSTSTPAASS
jgi:GAF domain-containing protein